MRPWVDTDLSFWHRIGVSQTFFKYKDPNLLNCIFFPICLVAAVIVLMVLSCFIVLSVTRRRLPASYQPTPISSINSHDYISYLNSSRMRIITASPASLVSNFTERRIKATHTRPSIACSLANHGPAPRPKEGQS